MSQIVPPVPDAPDSPTPLPPSSPKMPNDRMIQYVRARVMLFVLSLILALVFYGNPLIYSFITIMLVLFTISIFDPVTNSILEHFEKLLTLLVSPLERFWHHISLNHLASLSRWFKQRRGIVIKVASPIALAILLAATTLHSYVAPVTSLIGDQTCLAWSWSWVACSSGYGVSTLPYEGIHIGVIGNNSYGPFDQSTLNQDEISVETKIFGEDQVVCTTQHITLIAVTTLSRTVDDPLSGAKLGVQNLLGDYLAQQKYNATHPATRLCLVIANLGTPDTANSNSTLVSTCSACYAVPQVFRQMAQLAHADPTVRGLVGFPFSQQVTEALATRANYPSLANLPIISPSASSDGFSNTPRFYRIDAPDLSQGQAMAQFFCSNLLQKSKQAIMAVLTDSSDPYSGDLPVDFTNSLSKNPGCASRITLPAPIQYKNGDTQSVQAAVNAALAARATYIFFPGYDEDLDAIQSEIHSINPSQFVAILGGDGLNNVDATTHYAYYPVYAASFAQPLPLQNALVQEYKKEKISKIYSYGHCLWVPKDTLLAFDAIQVFTQTLQMEAHQTNPIGPVQFTTDLKSIVFQGESGPIWLQGNRTTSGHISDRTQVAIYITFYNQNYRLQLLDSYLATIDIGQMQEVKIPAQQCA